MFQPERLADRRDEPREMDLGIFGAYRTQKASFVDR